MLSIIIIALNEENNIKALLESIKKQSARQPLGFDYEIIVADAGSRDKTIFVAQSYNCIITEGGLPALGRNKGARIARGEWFLFLDADSVMPDDFLRSIMSEVESRRLDVVSCRLLPISENKKSKLYFDLFYNKPIVLLEKILPHGADAILITKKLFEKIGGFDETITLAEDHDMIRRAARLGKFGIARSVELYVSDRRFQKDGWLATGLKYFFCELHMIFLGPVKSKIFNYKFNHYDNKK